MIGLVWTLEQREEPALYENETRPQRALLVSLDTGEYDVESSVAELEELTRTAGAEPVCILTQKRPAPDTATCIGSGMVEQAAEVCAQQEIDLLIFDRELSPTQIRNLEGACRVQVIDRTTLILDIFAKSAKTNEGKIQVELAQLQYLLPRLAGRGKALSRLGGGIGTRGPGETKLETDRRHIRRRIHNLEEALKKTEKQRLLRRTRRKKTGVLTAAIVGYTNAGKSTLLNALTGAGVLAQDRLFATLDPTSRALKLPDGRSVMLIDTVGFVSRLPHTLVDAFHSTLEEAAAADLLINVCDASDPRLDRQLAVTKEVMEQLGAGSTPMVTVLNKCDICREPFLLPFSRRTVRISAKTGEGLRELLQTVADTLPDTVRRIHLRIPYSEAGKAAEIRRFGLVENEAYEEDGIHLTARLDLALLAHYQKYRIPE